MTKHHSLQMVLIEVEHSKAAAINTKRDLFSVLQPASPHPCFEHVNFNFLSVPHRVVSQQLVYYLIVGTMQNANSALFSPQIALNRGETCARALTLDVYL
jgi:hypothetical protein